MNKTELNEALADIAKKDLSDGADILDHPCAVAIRAINKAFEDIEILRKIAPKKRGSKRVQMLTGLTYDPDW